jgi:hypothetical protein
LSGEDDCLRVRAFVDDASTAGLNACQHDAGITFERGPGMRPERTGRSFAVGGEERI